MTAISVVIPLYDGAAFIGETLDSLAAQTEPPAEVIVVDDGSSDDGPDLVARHRVRPLLLHQDHAGVAVARNRGAVAASAPYVAFLDQDDLWLPARHARLCRFLDAHPTCRALVTTERSFHLAADAERLRAMGEMLHRHADLPAVGSVSALVGAASDDGSVPPVERVITTRDLLAGTVTVTTSYVFHRETFLSAGGCAPFARSLDDYWALLNLSRLGAIPLVDEPSVLYRIHPSSTTMSTSWSLPLLTSLAAARFGGNLVPLDRARDPGAVVPLDDERGFWRHQLLGLAREGSTSALLDAWALIRLLGCSPAERRRLALRQARATLGAALRRRRG